MDDYSTLGMLDAAFEEGAAASFITSNLVNLNAFSGSKNMDDGQTKSLARLLANEYRDMKFSVLMLFFYRFKAGGFGKFYGKVDPMDITCALRDFVAECEAKRQEYLNEEYAKKKEEEKRNSELRHRAESQWFRCQSNLIEKSPDEGGKDIFQRISFLYYYDNKRTILLSVSSSDYELIESRYLDYFRQAIISFFPNIRVQCTIKDKEA